MATGRKAANPDPAELQKMLAAAVQHQAAGRLGEAASLCKKVLSIAPKAPGALHLLGLVEHRAGRSEDGAALIARAVAINPSDVAAQNNLGLVLLHMNKVEEAKTRFEKALSLNPDYAEALNNLGTVCSRGGDVAVAEQYFRHALEKKPTYPEALNNLGTALAEQERFEEAAAQYKAALKLRPSYADALANLGHALTRLNRLEEAGDKCRAALAISPQMPKALVNLGNVLQKQGRIAEAEAAFQQATEVDSTNALAFENLGRVALMRERCPIAVSAFRKAIELDPKPITLFRMTLALIADYRAVEAETLIRDALKSQHDDARLLTALGVVLTELNKTEEALTAFRDAITIDPNLSDAHCHFGTALMEIGELESAAASFRRAIEIDVENTKAFHSLAIIRKYTARDEDVALLENASTHTDSAATTRALIDFGLGKVYDDLGEYDLAFKHIARGNALRRQTLDFSIETETRVFERLRRVFDQDYIDRFKNAGVAGDGIVFILGMPRSGTSLVEQILASHPSVHGAGELMDLHLAVQRTLASVREDRFEERFCHATAEDLAAIGQSYLSGVQAKAPEARIITDKLPANFLYAGLIPLILPGAKIVHCRRNPVDNCLSLFMNVFITGQHFSYDQTDLGQYYRLYLDLMKHWDTLLPGRIHDIAYEDLIAAPEKITLGMLGYCGLEWSDACLAFHKTRRTVKTASVAQVREPIYTNSVRAWRRYEHHLQPLLSALGNAADPVGRETL